jgi:hypothetical protein
MLVLKIGDSFVESFGEVEVCEPLLLLYYADRVPPRVEQENGSGIGSTTWFAGWCCAPEIRGISVPLI